MRSFAGAEEIAGTSGGVRVVLTEPGQPLGLSRPDSLPPEVVAELRPVRDGKVDRS